MKVNEFFDVSEFIKAVASIFKAIDTLLKIGAYMHSPMAYDICIFQMIFASILQFKPYAVLIYSLFVNGYFRIKS